MPEPFRRKPNVQQTDAVQISPVLISDITPDGFFEPSITHNHPSLATKPTPRERLARLDERLGPVNIGEMSISRVELYRMGAQLNDVAGSTGSAPLLQSDGALIDSVRFDPLKIEQHIKAQPSPDAPDATLLLFELASQRTAHAPPIFDMPPGSAPSAPMHQLDKLLSRLQAMEAAKNRPVPDGLPKWVNTAKSNSLITAGLGMQAYGIYGGLIGIRDGLQQGNFTEVAVSAAEIGTEMGSILVENGLLKTGEAMLRQGAQVGAGIAQGSLGESGRTLLRQGDKVLRGFTTTSIGKWLIRGAGLMASLLTLPFDIYNAIKAFDAAANSSGKDAMDHYFTAGMSLTSAALSLAIGAAALAGFSSAGPLGLLACAVLIAGARVYSAVRQVDDIDDYIELNIDERWRSGWFAFTGQALDTSVMERYQVERLRVSYAKSLKEQAQKLLAGELKDSVEAIVSGHFQVEMQPVRYWKFQWENSEQPYQEVEAPNVVESDDVVDASHGLDRVPCITTAESDPAKGVYWQLGGGNDQVFGLHEKPNYFNFSTGKKSLTGGDKNDAFMFQVTETLKEPAADSINALHGGAGSDTLSLQGQLPPMHGFTYTGHEINLHSGRLGLLKTPTDTPSIAYATMTSIENVETLTGGASRVTGDRLANQITLNGAEDTANGGPGDDLFRLMGNFSQVDGGPGKDRYFVALNGGIVSIAEDGQEQSIIELDCALETIQHWHVQGTSLKVMLLRGFDGTLPAREILITDVYALVDARRSLRNDALLFVTQDAYTLKPDLPDTLQSTEDHEVSVTIVKQGIAPPAPVIFNGGTGVLPSSSTGHYFIPRDTPAAVFDIQEQKTDAPATLFVDYDSHELETIQACYQVDSRYISHFNYLTYSNTRLVLRFRGNTRLTLKNWVRNGNGAGTNVSATLMAAGLEPVHPIILVLRDGQSYRVGTPAATYYNDHQNPGERQVEGRQALHQRHGHYGFRQPTHEPAIRLPAKPQRIKLPERLHTSIYELEGSASTYEVHPSPGATLRLSTTRTTGASIWNVHMDGLDKDLSHTDIHVGETRILVGDVRLLVAQTSDTHQPPEAVVVILASGDRYQIDQRSEQAKLLSMAGRNHADVASILLEIKAREAQNNLATTLLSVSDIRLEDGTAGGIFYDTQEQRWTVDSDWARIVNSSDLIISPN